MSFTCESVKVCVVFTLEWIKCMGFFRTKNKMRCNESHTAGFGLTSTSSLTSFHIWIFFHLFFFPLASWQQRVVWFSFFLPLVLCSATYVNSAFFFPLHDWQPRYPIVSLGVFKPTNQRGVWAGTPTSTVEPHLCVLCVPWTQPSNIDNRVNRFIRPK